MVDHIKAHRINEGIRILSTILGMAITFIALPLCVALLVVWLSGCTAMMNRTPITESTVLQAPQPVAYQRAAQALAQMGATLTTSDARTGLLSGQVHNAVVLTVQVQPHAQGAQVTATGSLMPNKMAFGSFSEVSDYMAILKALP